MGEQRELAGIMARNTKRENDRQPEFRGSCTINGVAYWISAWVKEGQDGKFFSLSFKRKELREAPRASAPGPRVGGANFDKALDDEIPF